MSDYIEAIWVHWISLMGGIVSLAATVVSRWLRQRKNRHVPPLYDSSGSPLPARSWWQQILKIKKIPDPAYAIIAGTCLFFAGYQTWADERAKVVRYLQGPRVSFKYENTESYIIPPEKRPKPYNDWPVFIEVDTTAPLYDALVQVYSASRKGSDESTSVHASLARNGGKDPFGSTDIFLRERYAFFDGSGNGRRLSLLTSEKAPELDFMNNMAPGEYELELVVTAKNLNKPAGAIARIKWSGTMKDFKMTLKPD